jgi:Uncharacterized protein conserved in bacteria (DUF2255)
MSVKRARRLYVRGYNGPQSRWYQAAIRQKAGRIRAAGMTKDVVFEPVDGPINDRIDEAYRAEYAGSPYLKPIIAARARERRTGLQVERPPTDLRPWHEPVLSCWNEGTSSTSSFCLDSHACIHPAREARREFSCLTVALREERPAGDQADELIADL